jgi:hypothetical protein
MARESRLPIDWISLAPCIEHETRESIVEALRWIGPLAAPDLKAVLDDPELPLAYVAYHASALVKGEALVAIGERPAGASIEKVYFLAPPK